MINRYPGIDFASVKYIDQRGAYLNGKEDYMKLVHWSISGPFVQGAYYYPECDS